jgi:hypothetical protein
MFLTILTLIYSAYVVPPPWWDAHYDYARDAYVVRHWKDGLHL